MKRYLEKVENELKKGNCVLVDFKDSDSCYFGEINNKYYLVLDGRVDEIEKSELNSYLEWLGKEEGFEDFNNDYEVKDIDKEEFFELWEMNKD